MAFLIGCFLNQPHGARPSALGLRAPPQLDGEAAFCSTDSINTFPTVTMKQSLEGFPPSPSMHLRI